MIVIDSRFMILHHRIGHMILMKEFLMLMGIINGRVNDLDSLCSAVNEGWIGGGQMEVMLRSFWIDELI